MKKTKSKNVSTDELAVMVKSGFDSVEKRIDGVEQGLNKKIDGVEERLTSKIDHLTRRIDALADYNSRIRRLERIVDSLQKQH